MNDIVLHKQMFMYESKIAYSVCFSLLFCSLLRFVFGFVFALLFVPLFGLHLCSLKFFYYGTNKICNYASGHGPARPTPILVRALAEPLGIFRAGADRS